MTNQHMKKKIALVTGGYSGEAVVSYKSAKTIRTHLDPERYEVYLIDVCKEGWFYEGADGSRTPVNRNDFSVQHNGSTVHFDAAFIGMHGTPGEDGKLQGYFDLLGIPYTSCGAATSALTFNKRYTVAVAAFSGIHVAKSAHLLRHVPYDVAAVAAGLRFPVFVKPNNGGSSIGMSKVDDPLALEAAVERAFAEDSQVLVEEMIEGREFTIGVFEKEGAVIALPMTEVRAHADKAFFDFEAKYQGKSDEETPANATAGQYERVSEAARRIYRIFNCSGVIRIDFIYHKTEEVPYMLEINTVPGQSDASIIPQQVRAYGWTLEQFYSTLIEEALRKKALTT